MRGVVDEAERYRCVYLLNIDVRVDAVGILLCIVVLSSSFF